MVSIVERERDAQKWSLREKEKIEGGGLLGEGGGGSRLKKEGRECLACRNIMFFFFGQFTNCPSSNTYLLPPF